VSDRGDQRRQKPCGGRHGDPCRRAVADLDQTGAFQRDERLANCRTADPEGRLQFPLGRQAVPGLELSGQDKPF
jgi:hypothetical protein